MFASATVIEHIARGVAGFGAISVAIVLAREPSVGPVVGSVTLALASLVAFRGCPICWTIGMVETMLDRERR